MTATETWQLWQSKLSLAKAGLTAFEEELGTLALAGDATELAATLAKLRSAVTIAEAAERSARAAAPDPRIEQKRRQLETAQASVRLWQAEAEKWAAIQQQLEPAWIEARDKCLDAMHRLMMHERSERAYKVELETLLAQSGALEKT